jgi:hypothetical protein
MSTTFHSTVNTAPIQSPWTNRIEQAVLITLLAYTLLAIFTGPLRWSLGLIKLTPLVYLPQMMMLTITPIALLWEARNGISKRRAFGVLTIGFWTLTGLLQLPTAQVGFGIYVLLPLWFGLACGSTLYRHWATISQYCSYLWLAATVGIFINNFIAYPWEGYSYSVGDIEVVGSREWENIGGGKRIAGFARASFDAGLQVLLLGLITAIVQVSGYKRLFSWATTFLAIYLTTSKGIYNVFIVLTPLVLTQLKLPTIAIRPIPLVIGLIGIVLPMTPLFMQVNFYIKDPILANLTFSFWDRLNDMWPNAWKLLHELGHPLWGRGLGGIGTAQTYFESIHFNAADNLFMYWFVIGGWINLPLFIWILLRTIHLSPLRSPQEGATYCLILANLIYGITANVVESGFFALSTGLVIRAILSNHIETEKS